MYSNFHRVGTQRKAQTKKLLFFYTKLTENFQFGFRGEKEIEMQMLTKKIVQRKRTSNPDYPSDPQKTQRSETHIYSTKPI